MSGSAITGGCQCGAVRFRAAGLGRASLCHCRMCQKALGGPGTGRNWNTVLKLAALAEA